MIKAIQQFFEQSLTSTSPHSEDELNLATAALLVEVMVADDHGGELERAQLIKLLENEFDVAAGHVEELLAHAEASVKESNDLYQFTRQINDNFQYPEKTHLIEALWRIAYADGRLDKYEEYTIRKISELLYVHHNDFIKAKITARSSNA
ncbi:Uncharacterised protein [BD1-7 clade bacterium]|uniref:Co-chaperone DjlA N-terminal domain-containing protein n=1 Tax=BD1-7 clade bacterium TaxID=2029982 RepID=A0A5S9QTM3_9GAMM|nr:Uncharacterised protein [BD1-7 clade bacterium]CAA0122149.1 Uncharacterised protein [BD1-7 clade bacterium]